MKLAALSLILAVMVAGCTSTGQVAKIENQPVDEQPITETVIATETPPMPPSTNPSTNKCADNSECPSGMSCLKNICVKVQFVK